MNLVPVEYHIAEEARKWRNLDISGLRTPYMLTEAQQRSFCDSLPNSRHRYFGFMESGELIAFGGVADIQWENSIGEISLIINPSQRKKGLGRRCVEMILEVAFDQLNLKTVHGECYKCNPAVSFWEKICDTYESKTTSLWNRKFWNGQYYDSLYFSIDADEYRIIHK